MLLSVEIMLNAVNLTFVAVGRYLGTVDGQIITFFVMTVAAAEAAVGLALVVALFRHRETLSPDAFTALKWRRNCESLIVNQAATCHANPPDGSSSCACRPRVRWSPLPVDSRLALTITQMLLLIPLLPFLGFVVNAFFGRRLSKSVSGGVACAAIIASFGVSVAAVWGVVSAHEPLEQVAFTWFSSGELSIPFGVRLDNLSCVMILVVTGIGSLIHIYSTGYMH